MITNPEVQAALHRLSGQLGWENGISDIEQRKADDDRPLHVFCWRKDVDGVACLIRAGAEVDARGDMRDTPLIVAAQMASPEIVKLLLDAGADRSLIGEFETTALQSAILSEEGAPLEEQAALREVIELLSNEH